MATIANCICTKDWLLDIAVVTKVLLSLQFEEIKSDNLLLGQ